MNHKSLERAFVTISKEKLATLPVATYTGKIKVIDKKELIEDAISELRKADLIGFDTETRPSFKKGQNYKVALIQLATKDCCYLFRTNIIGFPQELIDLLEDPALNKVGLSIHDDFHNLAKFTALNPQAFIELQSFVKDYKIVDNSLSRLYGILFGERISKAQRLSNWEVSELSAAQMTYAAIDAYACIKIYNYLKEGKFNPLETEFLTFPPEEEIEETQTQIE